MFERLKRLWKLSEFEPAEVGKKYNEPGTIMAMITKKPSNKATFIPHIKQSPIKKITEEKDENN